MMVFAWTPPAFGYGRLWIAERHLTFVQVGIKACYDGLLTLSEHHSSMGYEVIIGTAIVNWNKNHAILSVQNRWLAKYGVCNQKRNTNGR